jgi:hypothetical protein
MRKLIVLLWVVFLPITSIVAQTDEEIKVEELKHTEQNNKNSSTYSPFLFYGVIGSLIISLIVIFSLSSKVKKLKSGRSIKKNPKHSKTNSLNPDRFNLNSELINLRVENRELKINIEYFKKEIEKLKANSISVIEHPNSDIISDTTSKSIKLNVPEQKTSNLIYLSSPFQNLTFANEDASKDKTLNTLYQVEFNEQMQTGDLSVLVDSDLSKALNSPDSYLETACTYDNEYSNNARAIKVIENGEIKLEGEDWIVTKKVRIKFI